MQVVTGDGNASRPSECPLTRMHPELRLRCDQVRTALAEVGPKDVRVRYGLGALVKEVREDASRYGKGAVRQMALSLGFGQKTLYRHATVASSFTVAELNDVLECKGSTVTARPRFGVLGTTLARFVAEHRVLRERSPLFDGMPRLCPACIANYAPPNASAPTLRRLDILIANR